MYVSQETISLGDYQKVKKIKVARQIPKVLKIKICPAETNILLKTEICFRQMFA